MSSELEKIEKQTEIHHVKVSDLKAELIGCEVVINCQVVGEATQKAIPKIVELSCQKCGYTKVIDYSTLKDESKEAFLSSVVFGKNDGLARMVSNHKCDMGLHKWTLRVVDYMDFSILFVRDLLDPLIKFDSRVYQTRRFYFVGQTVPYAKKVTLQGRVYLEPSTKNITVIAEKIELYEDEVSSFEVTEKDKEDWTRYFMDRNPGEMLSQVAPGMVGRPKVQKGLVSS